MSVVETVLIYVVIPAGVLAALAFLVVAPHRGRRPRYRSGQPWEHPPVWWSANPEGLDEHRHPDRQRIASALGTAARSVVGGGARGTW